MVDHGAESGPESGLDSRELVQALVYGILILTSTVWLIIGFRSLHLAILSVHLCVGLLAAVMLARLLLGSASIIDI